MVVGDRMHDAVRFVDDIFPPADIDDRCPACGVGNNTPSDDCRFTHDECPVCGVFTWLVPGADCCETCWFTAWEVLPPNLSGMYQP